MDMFHLLSHVVCCLDDELLSSIHMHIPASYLKQVAKASLLHTGEVPSRSGLR